MESFFYKIYKKKHLFDLFNELKKENHYSIFFDNFQVKLHRLGSEDSYCEAFHQLLSYRYLGA